MVAVLLERIGDQRQDLLILVQQQHSPQVTQTLVRKARGGQQLQTFNLSKVRPLAQREEIEQFRNIVSPAQMSTCALPVQIHHPPHVGVVAFLPEAGANGGALLLHDCALVGDCLGSAHIADELLHCLALVLDLHRNHAGPWRTRSHCAGLLDPTGGVWGDDSRM
jgi:hypothetical protein